MDKLSLEDLKRIELGILLEFDKICKKNGLHYSLAYGTLIGAIRHKGFIPWDDDIDIMMPRDDYNKLVRLKIKNSDYEILSYENSKNYNYLFSKMIDKKTILIEDGRYGRKIGVYIDIFPIDKLDYSKIDLICMNSKKYQKKFSRIFTKKENKNIIYNLIKDMYFYLNKPFTRNLLSGYDKLITSYYSNSSEIGTGCFSLGLLGIKDYFNFDIFDEGYIDQKFEGYEFPIIKKYDLFLRQIYGNYMEYPPLEKRIAHHRFCAYEIKNRN